MEKPTFDRFHPNASACANACNEADEGNYERACTWLSDAQTALEYQENSDDYGAAVAYVQHKADEAGVRLKTEVLVFWTRWSVDAN